ncbi:hypothetical protein ACR79T_18805 [Sphingobacterium spiritivorum]|uniref:hypothetical protein n=1 Tax=Sphingobacterium spiritivorum TaxID=258 RepID=UPI003DA61E2A
MKTKSIFPALFITAIGAVWLSSCNGSSVDTVKSLESDYENQNKKVELTGEFDAPSFTFASGRSKTLGMHFVVKPHAISSEKFIVTDVVLPIGTDKNTVVMDIADGQKNYTLKDFYIYDKDGNKYNLDEHTQFKISGTVSYNELEKEESERRTDNFAYKLTDVTIEKD